MIVKAIVNEGVEVINAAGGRSAAVTVVDCLSSTHWESTQSELVSKPSYWWNGPKGTVEAVATGEGQILKVKVNFAANNNHTPLKSFCLRVTASDDESERAFYLYVYSDGNSAITLKEPVSLTFDVPINVSSDVISPDGSIVDDNTQAAIDTALAEAKEYTDALADTIGSTYFNAASIDGNTLILTRPDGSSVDIDLS